MSPVEPLPVAELHLHIEGTLEPEMLVALAARNGVTLPTTDLAELRARYRFAGLRAFLDLYYANLPVLRSEQDFYDLATAYLNRAAAGGVRRAEIFFDPQTHLANDVPLAAVFAGLSGALADGRSRLGLSADLIPFFLPAVGWASAEIGPPPPGFRNAYHQAPAEALPRVPHAGEEGGPDYVWEAIDLL